MRVRGKNQAAARAALVLSAMLGLGRIASAEPESVRIDYAAPPGCPDAAAFMRSLRERTTRFHEARPDEDARTFLVRVRAVASSFAGRLQIRSPDGRTTIRDVDATICDEVTGALALITALTIDPDALVSGSKGENDSRAGASSDPGSPAGRSTSSSATAAVATLPATPAAEPAQPWQWSAGLLAHTTLGLSPALGYGGDLFVEAEAPGSSRLGPAVRLGVFLNQSDVDLATGAGARFQWALMLVEGCPVRLGWTGFAMHPCLAFRVGVLHGEGRRISKPDQTVSFWSDVGPVLRLRSAVTARLLVEAQAGVSFPLHRPTFDIVDMGSATHAYSVPRAGGSVAIGVAYRFR
jgi:hypothetical protein